MMLQRFHHYLIALIQLCLLLTRVPLVSCRSYIDGRHETFVSELDTPSVASSSKTTDNVVPTTSPTAQAAPVPEFEEAIEAPSDNDTDTDINNSDNNKQPPPQDTTTTSDGHEEEDNNGPDRENGSPPLSPPTSIDGDRGLRPNGIILICLGSALVILAAICWRRRRQQQREREEQLQRDGAAIGLLSDPGDDVPTFTV